MLPANPCCLAMTDPVVLLLSKSGVLVGFHVLLHLLPDRAVRCDGASLQIMLFLFLWSAALGRDYRRMVGDSDRPPQRDRDLDPRARCPSALTAVCDLVDRRAQRRDQFDHVERVRLYPHLCIDLCRIAWASSATVLWLGVRARRVGRLRPVACLPTKSASLRCFKLCAWLPAWGCHFSALPRRHRGEQCCPGPRLNRHQCPTRVASRMRTLWPWLSAVRDDRAGALRSARNFRDTSTALVPDRRYIPSLSNATVDPTAVMCSIVPHGRRPLAVDDFQSPL